MKRMNRGHTLAVLGVALIMRLLVVWTVLKHYPPQWLFTRGVEMGLLAKAVLAGQGLSSPFGGSTGPTAFIAPVYPLLIALVFKLFGQFTPASGIVILLAQTALNLLTVWLIMRLAYRLFNQASATVAGLIWSCSLPLVWMPTIFWETSLSCCLLAGLLALAISYRDRERIIPIQWMSLGGYCGAAGLVNPALLPSLLAIALWLALQSRGTPSWRPFLSLLTFVVVFSPWPLRNAKVFHAFIPLRTTVGFELWMGNHRGADGFLDESLFPMYNKAELEDYKSRGEVAYSAHKTALATQYICDHPATFLRTTAVRAKRFWTGTGSRNGSMLFAAHAVFTAVFGFAGLWLLIRSRQYALSILFLLPLVLFPLPYLITHAEFRYRLVIDPLLSIFSGSALTELYRRILRLPSASGHAAASASGQLLDNSGRTMWRPH